MLDSVKAAKTSPLPVCVDKTLGSFLTEPECSSPGSMK